MATTVTKQGTISISPTPVVGQNHITINCSAWAVSGDSITEVRLGRLYKSQYGAWNTVWIYVNASVMSNTLAGFAFIDDWALKAGDSIQYFLGIYGASGEIGSAQTQVYTMATNVAPSAPSSISASTPIYGGSTATVSWGASTDSDGNLSGYVLEKSENNGTWTSCGTTSSCSMSVSVSSGISSIQFRVRAYDSAGAYSGYTTSTSYACQEPNSAPSVPSSISATTPIKAGSSTTVSWGASTDSDGNLSGYVLEKSEAGGSWTQAYSGSARSVSVAVSAGVASVQFRVRAYDTKNAYSGYRTSNTYAVSAPPTAPPSINVLPLPLQGGTTVTVSWGTASDPNNDLAGYELEGKFGSDAWTNIYRGTGWSARVAVPFEKETGQFRVRAYDSEGSCSGYTQTAIYTITNQHRPVITTDQPHSAGILTDGIRFRYTVSDADPGTPTLTVTERLDGEVIRIFTIENGDEDTFELIGMDWMSTAHGSHVITITASDGYADTTYEVTFERVQQHVFVTLAEGYPADIPIDVVSLSILGELPEDALLGVEVTNNWNRAKPSETVWEDATVAVAKGFNYVFTHKNIASGCLNFRLSIHAGESGNGGYITAIKGGFE